MLKLFHEIGFTLNELPFAPKLHVLDDKGQEIKMAVIVNGSPVACLEETDVKGVFLEAIKADLVPYSLSQRGSFWRMAAVLPQFTIVKTPKKVLVLETI